MEIRIAQCSFLALHISSQNRAPRGLKSAATANGKTAKPLSEDALPALMGYDWPGNVRELRAAIELGVVMSNSPRIMLKHLPAYLSGGGHAAPRVQGRTHSGGPIVEVIPQDLNLETMERKFIEAALKRTGNNRTEAAELPSSC